MPHARRRFLQQLALAGAVLAAARSNPLRAAAAPNGAPGYSKFAARLGREFAASLDGATSSLRLIEVTRPKSLKGYADPVKAREQCFTLIFRGDAKNKLAEGIYRVESAGLAPFEAFMSPILGDGVSYQIVFNNA